MTASNLCMFCFKKYFVPNAQDNLKEMESGEYTDENGAVCNLKTFFKLLRRFVGGNDLPEKEMFALEYYSEHRKGKLLLGCCEDCSVMVNTFCETYHQMKVLELKLEWKLEKVMNIMKCADNRKLNNTDALEHFKSARRDLISKCTRRLSNSQPKVTVNRHSTESTFDLKPNPLSLSDNTLKIENEMTSLSSPLIFSRQLAAEIFYDWITSYVAVALLATMSPCRRTRVENQLSVANSTNKSTTNENSISSSSNGQPCKQRDVIIITLSDSDDEQSLEDGAAEQAESAVRSRNGTLQEFSNSERLDSQSKKYQSTTSRKHGMANPAQAKVTVASSVKNIPLSSMQSNVLMNMTAAKSISVGQRMQTDESSSSNEDDDDSADSSSSSETSQEKKKHFAKKRKRNPNNRVYCGICGKTTRESYMDRHMKRWHNGTAKTNQVQQCTVGYCPAYFTSRWQLHLHKREIHKVIPITLQADEGEEMDSFERDEMGTNTGFLCKICTRAFSTLSHLKIHTRRYHRRDAERLKTPVKTSRNTFICPVFHCALSFSTVDKLQSHRKLHGNFKCDYCGIIKDYAPELVIHKMEHAGQNSGNVPHLLKESLSTGNSLNSTWMWKCQFCEERFAHRHGWKNHVKATHGKD